MSLFAPVPSEPAEAEATAEKKEEGEEDGEDHVSQVKENEKTEEKMDTSVSVPVEENKQELLGKTREEKLSESEEEEGEIESD